MNMMKNLLWISALTLTVACGDKGGETGSTTDGTTSGTTDGGGDGGSSADGAALFTSNCSGCHGADGTGVSGPNITGEDNRAAMIAIVTNGEGGMPAFGSTLSGAEIEAIVDYVINDL